MKLREVMNNDGDPFAESALSDYAKKLRDKLAALQGNDKADHKAVMNIKKALHDLMNGRALDDVRRFLNDDDEVDLAK